MKNYTENQIDDWEDNRSEWLRRSDRLADLALSYPFSNLRAEKFAREGFVRRLKNLDHAMNRLSELYPPNLDNASRDTVRDAELFIQAFVMNIFGSIDNLAWIWVLERNVMRPDGKNLLRSEIVFDGPRANILLASLTPAVASVIHSADSWFKVLRIYRDGVAHQIPIYIPRFLNESEAATADSLNTAINEAISTKNIKLMSELLDERTSLGDYGAYMALSEEHATIMVHPQLVSDLATVVNLGETLFSELGA